MLKMSNNLQGITRKILENVTTNKDHFTWKQFNCNYRPWGVAFKGINEENYQIFLLLVSYIESYIGVDRRGQMYEFLTLYDDYLKGYFKIEIEKNHYTNKYEMLNSIKKNIDSNKLIVFPGDIYELFYNPMYKVEHYHHFFIVKGYDTNKDLLYILDNIHIDCGASTSLTDFMIRVDELFNIGQAYYDEYERDSIPYFYSMKKGLKFQGNSLSVLKGFIENVDRIHWEKEAYKLIKNDKSDFNIRKVYGNMNFKDVFFETLKNYFIEAEVDKDEIDKVKKKYSSIKNIWSSFFIKVQYIKSKNKDIDESFDKLVESYVLEEEELISDIKNILENIQETAAKDNVETCGMFKVLNKNKAEILEEEGYLMKLDDSKTYDTWLAEDNAAQLLIEDIKDTCEFGVMVKTKSKVGEDHHTGIIVKMEDGTKYLFGVYRSEGISIFCPNLEKNNEVYKMSKFALSECSIKVEINDKNILFYILNSEDNKYENVYSQDISCKVENVGLFAKTWVKIKHSAKFTNVFYKELR